MPRVKINSIKYKLVDLPVYIRTKMITANKTQADLARAIGITPASFTNRMQKGLFSYSDLVLILAEVGATDDEIIKLFRKDYFKK